MAFQIEMIVDVGVYGGELLQALHALKSQHRSLPYSEREMRVLDPIVGPATDVLALAAADLCRLDQRLIGIPSVYGYRSETITGDWGRCDADHARTAVAMAATMTSDLGPIILSQEPVFRIAALSVDPATRLITRDDGRTETVEPRIMQVLVLLAQATDRFVSREELIARCWDNRIVSTDAVNRIISRVRGLAGGIGSGSFAIETRNLVGYKLVPAVLPSQASLEQTSARGNASIDRRVLLGGGAIAVLAGGAGLAWMTSDQTRTEQTSGAGRPAFAILPFRTESDRSEIVAYANGIADALRFTLSRNGGIDVIAAASSRTISNRDLTAREMGRQLGADYLVEGRLAVIGTRIEVRLALVDTTTERQIWAEGVADDRGAIGAVEEAASAVLVQQISSMIPPEAVVRAPASRRRDPTVYAYVLQARALLDGVRARQMRGQDAASLEAGDRAEALAARALAIDSRDPGALMIRAVLARNGWTTALAAKRLTTEQRTAQAVGYIRQALVSDPNDPVALTELGDYYRRFQFRWTEAENLFRRALATDPSLDTAHWAYAHMLGTTGRAVEGIDHALAVRRLDPANPFRRLALPRLLYVSGRRDLTMRLYEHEFAVTKDNLFLVRELYIMFLCERDAAGMRRLSARLRANWQGRVATPDEERLLARIAAAAEALSGRPTALGRLIDADLAAFDDPRTLKVATPQGRARDDLPYIFALEYAQAGRTESALDMLGRALAAKSLYWPATLPYGITEFPAPVRNHPRYAALWRRDPGLIELVARRRKAVTSGQTAGVTPDGRRVSARLPAALLQRVEAAIAVPVQR